MPAGPGRRLVCDIGGGSTEIIIGEGLEPLELESLQMGCVRLSEEFFADGRLSQKRMQRARVAARQAIEPYQAAFRRRGWDEAVGSSGHRARHRRLASASSIRRRSTSAPTASNASFTSSASIEHIRDLKLSAITEDRKLSFAGGVAILAEVFEQLGIESMRVADGAMREGLLYDLLGRYTDEDARERTVRSMQERYHVDLAQAERVEATAVDFLRAGGGGVAARGSGDRADAALGRAPARDRPRRRAQRLPPPRRLSTGECRHGRVSARGTEAAGHHGRQPPAQACDRGSGRARAALGQTAPA